MYFEIFHQRNLIKRGTKILGGLRWSNEMMFIPSTTAKLPIEYREFLSGHDEMKIFVNDKCFWGIIEKLVENKEDETIDVYLEHVIHEWTYRQISVNNAVKDGNMNVVYKGAETNNAGNYRVSASDFTVFLDELGTMTNERYVSRAGASGWTADGNTVNVVADASGIKAEAGEYDVTFSAGDAMVTVKANVKADPDETERDNYALVASNFSIFADDVGKLSDADYIKLAGAKVYLITVDEETGEEISRKEVSNKITVDASSIRARDGVYTVKFSTTYRFVPEEGPAEDRELNLSVTATVEGDNFADSTIADNISDIYADFNFAYPGWRINYEHGAGDYTIDYVYSRQDKLEALSKTVELTTDLFWRVRFVNERVVDVSPFGDIKDYIISTKPSGAKNIRIIKEPTITHDFSNVINVASVYSEKSDTGMSSMTLREVYNDPSLQEDGFPVVIIRANVNNERDYHEYTEQYPKLAPNNELEYAVIDEESVALEGGVLIEGTYAFNDLAPFAVDIGEETEEITDEDRITAATTAYHAAIKRLKLDRRTYAITLETEELPAEIAPGDKVRLLYDNNLYIMAECSNYLKKILSYNDYFYITRISYDIDETGAETNTVVLEKDLRIDRDLTEEQ